MPRPTDPCCSKCRTPFGVCGSKGACEHHRAAQWDQDLYDLTQSSAQDTRKYDHRAAQTRR